MLQSRCKARNTFLRYIEIVVCSLAAAQAHQCSVVPKNQAVPIDTRFYAGDWFTTNTTYPWWHKRPCARTIVERTADPLSFAETQCYLDADGGISKLFGNDTFATAATAFFTYTFSVGGVAKLDFPTTVIAAARNGTMLALYYCKTELRITVANAIDIRIRRDALAAALPHVAQFAAAAVTRAQSLGIEGLQHMYPTGDESAHCAAIPGYQCAGDW